MLKGLGQSAGFLRYIEFIHFKGLYLDLMPSGSEVIKLFSCSTQLSMKFKLLIDTKITKINGNFSL